MAVVTGATGALGRTVAKMLLENEAKLVVTYRTETKLRDLLEFLGQNEEKVIAVKTDVTSSQSVQNLARGTMEKHGRIDFLLNIVGAYAGGTDIADTDESLWDLMMNVNLKSAFLCMKVVLPFMIKQNYGKIVNVSSRTAVDKSRRVKSGAYAVSKAGIIVLTETVAEEVKNYEINVNCVMPSTIDTPDNRRNLPKADFSKWVSPREVTEAILFLLSDASKVTSGACIPVYGKA